MKKILISMVACAMMVLPGCDKIKDATSRDFKVNNIKFAFSAPANAVVATMSGEADVTTRAGATTSFTATRTVDISEMGSAELEEYAGKISKVAVNNALITVTANPSGAYTVTNLTVTADGVAGSLVIPTYTMGGTFTAPASMNAYTSTFLMRLLATKKVNVTVTGQSDAPAGTVININYESDAVFTANLF